MGAIEVLEPLVAITQKIANRIPTGEVELQHGGMNVISNLFPAMESHLQETQWQF